MINTQSKNIIKAVVIVLLCVILGEGVLGLGFFWPFLLVLLDWNGIYWLSLLVGVIISAIYQMTVGPASLYIVVVTAGLSFFFSSRKESGVIILLASCIADLVFDMLFGIPWSPFSLVAIAIAWFVAVRWFERGETIKLNY